MNVIEVVFVGDSIAKGYTPFVEETIQKRKPQNKVQILFRLGGSSAIVRARLNELALQDKPDIVHFNCGLHDLVVDPGKTEVRIPLERYRENLVAIVQTLKAETSARLFFATTTPVIEELHNKGGGLRRYEKDVQRYNHVAISVMTEQGIEINDLFECVEQNGRGDCVGADGRHMTKFGNQVLAEKIIEILPFPH